MLPLLLTVLNLLQASGGAPSTRSLQLRSGCAVFLLGVSAVAFLVATTYHSDSSGLSALSAISQLASTIQDAREISDTQEGTTAPPSSLDQADRAIRAAQAALLVAAAGRLRDSHNSAAAGSGEERHWEGEHVGEEAQGRGGARMWITLPSGGSPPLAKQLLPPYTAMRQGQLSAYQAPVGSPNPFQAQAPIEDLVLPPTGRLFPGYTSYRPFPGYSSYSSYPPGLSAGNPYVSSTAMTRPVGAMVEYPTTPGSTMRGVLLPPSQGEQTVAVQWKGVVAAPDRSAERAMMPAAKAVAAAAAAARAAVDGGPFDLRAWLGPEKGVCGRGKGSVRLCVRVCCVCARVHIHIHIHVRELELYICMRTHEYTGRVVPVES